MRIKQSRLLFEALEARFLAQSDDSGLESLVPDVRARGHLTRPEFQAVCRWKSPRTAPIVGLNSADEVEEVTAWSLRTQQERLRIESLLILRGVSWSTASVMLHFFHPDPYPILDVRAIWSVDMPAPSAYSFDFWWTYVQTCRRLSRKLDLSMRTIDRALWQFSKENQ